MVRKKFLFVFLMTLMIGVIIPVTAQEGSTVGQIRLAHLSADTSAVDIYVDGQLRSSLSEVEFPAMTGWITLKEGEHEIAIVPTGRSISTALFGGPIALDLEADTRTTAAVIGSRFDGSLTAQLIPEDYSDLSADTHASVTIFHAISGGPIVDILNNGEVLLGRFGFPGSVTYNDGTTNDGVFEFRVPAGTYNLAVVPNGQQGTTLIDLSDTELEAGMYYFVAAVGTADEPDVFIQVASG